MTFDNLDKYGLMELSDVEAQEVEGGFWIGLLCFVAGVVLGLFVYDRNSDQ